MIIVADTLRKLDFSKLKVLYAQDVERARRQNYRKLLPDEGTLCAQRDYLCYLDEVFFSQHDARMFVVEEGEEYITAVCFEPYKDGLLLNSLFTAPDFRRKGYAFKLLKFALDELPQLPVYAHVYNGNQASAKLHEKLGFSCLYNYAHLLDGSVRSDYLTLIRKP